MTHFTQEDLDNQAHTHVRTQGLRNGDYLEERDFEDLYKEGFLACLKMVDARAEVHLPFFTRQNLMDPFQSLLNP